MHRAHRPHIFSLPLVLICFALAAAQAVAPTALQVGTPVERTLGPGQTHNYTVALEQNQ